MRHRFSYHPHTGSVLYSKTVSLDLAVRKRFLYIGDMLCLSLQKLHFLVGVILVFSGIFTGSATEQRTRCLVQLRF